MQTELRAGLDAIRQNIRKVIKGKDDHVDLVIAAMLCGGHVLIEDLPGVGKTTLAKALAMSVSADFGRVQFTPDLLPTDILGGSVYNPKTGGFTFHRGPIFTNILLADEINRASPRTQSALLEAMAERQVTIENVRHELPGLFMVIATENPVEFHGTYPLPEAQLDRFLIRVELGYANEEDEKAILFDQRLTHPLAGLEPVIDVEAVLELSRGVREIHVADELGVYTVRLVRATRSHSQIEMGASPRGGLGMFHLAQAFAFMDGRDHVRPDDIQKTAVPVLGHRISLETKARYAGVRKDQVIQEILDQVAIPT